MRSVELLFQTEHAWHIQSTLQRQANAHKFWCIAGQQQQVAEATAAATSK
jgi:hypothetical protein